MESSYLDAYKIDGTVNFDQNPAFCNENTYPQFQQHLEQFKAWLKTSCESKQSSTIYKFGDGDFHFLRKSSVGSASPGRRALSKSYGSLENHQDFVDGVCKNDMIAVEIYNNELFHQLYPERKIDLPAEFGYGLVANKWFTKTFSGKIGLIGADEKLDLIQNLMQKKEYQEYLGLEDFNDYVKIPQRFACDDLENVVQSTLKQIKQTKDETVLFLVGIGHVKSGLLHRLKEEKNAIFYDVGSGIDALAGIIDFYRPFMGDWINHRLEGYDYGKIDFLQYTPVEEKEKWLSK